MNDPSTTHPDDPPAGPGLIAALALLWGIGLFLRIPVLAVAALAPDIAAELRLSVTGVGALTMVPVVMLALGAVPAAWVIARWGVRRAIALGLLASAVFSAARGLAGSAAALMAASVFMGAGIALFQAALPSAVRAWTPRRLALGSAVYLNGMMVGELAGAGLTLPVVRPSAGGDWRLALAIWAAPAAALGLLVLLRRDRVPVTGPLAAPGPWLPDWRSPAIWALGPILAASIASFFLTNAYMALILAERGQQDWLGPLLLAYNLTSLMASAVVIAAGRRVIGPRAPVCGAALVSALGLAGFALLGNLAGAAAAVLGGLAATVLLIVVMSLPPLLAEGMGVARLTAGMTLLGYAIAFVLVIGGGTVAHLAGTAAATVIPTILFTVALLAVQPRGGTYPPAGP